MRGQQDLLPIIKPPLLAQTPSITPCHLADIISIVEAVLLGREATAKLDIDFVTNLKKIQDWCGTPSSQQRKAFLEEANLIHPCTVVPRASEHMPANGAGPSTA